MADDIAHVQRVRRRARRVGVILSKSRITGKWNVWNREMDWILRNVPLVAAEAWLVVNDDPVLRLPEAQIVDLTRVS